MEMMMKFALKEDREEEEEHLKEKGFSNKDFKKQIGSRFGTATPTTTVPSS